MRYIITLIFLLTIQSGYTQTINGNIKDKALGFPLIGANITFVSSSDSLNTTSDASGNFEIDTKGKNGTLNIQFIGYQTYTTSVDLSKDDFLTIEMELKSIEMDINAIIVANPFESSVVRFNNREFQVLPGAYEDPSRLLLKAPAFANSNDQANFILYKGLPSHFVNWSINGIQIVNPNHTANAGSLSDVSSINAGGVNMISGHLIGSYEFSGSPSDLNTNNSIAGNSDIQFSDQYKSFLNLSLIGLEAGIGTEKTKIPIQLNYRYSTVGILTGLGADFSGEDIRYQDVFSRFQLINEDRHKANAFASYGRSSNVKPTFEDAKEAISYKELQNIEFFSDIFLSGIDYHYKGRTFDMDIVFNLSRKNDTRTALSDFNNYGTEDGLSQWIAGGYARIQKTSGPNTTRFGVRMQHFNDQRTQKSLHFFGFEREFVNTNVFPFLSYSADRSNWNFNIEIGANYNSLSENISMDGFGSVQYNFSRAFKGELKYRRNSQLLSNINFSYNYVPEEVYGNHYDLNLKWNRKLFSAFINFYHHQFSNILYEDDSNYSQYTGLDHPFVGKMNQDGKARINGFSVGFNHNKFLINGLKLSGNVSVFSSEYKNEEDWINNTFDFSNSFNLLAGYSAKLSGNREIILGASWHYRPGLNEFLINETHTIISGQTQYNFRSIPTRMIKPYHRMDFRFVYKMLPSPNRRFRQSLSLDIQNLYNRMNDAYFFYDIYQKEPLVQNQLGLIPILAYRIEF